MTLLVADIKRRLQIANCCAAKLGSEYIDKMKKGLPCDKKMSNVSLMNDLIDSIREYAVTVVKPSYTFSITACVALQTVEVFIDSVSIGIATAPGADPKDLAGEIAQMINNAFPAFPYTALGYEISVTIYGEMGAQQNDISVSFLAVGVGMITPSPMELSGGIDYKDLSETNCLTDQQITDILDRLRDLCVCKDCNEVVNFSDSDNNKINA